MLSRTAELENEEQIVWRTVETDDETGAVVRNEVEVEWKPGTKERERADLVAGVRTRRLELLELYQELSAPTAIVTPAVARKIVALVVDVALLLVGEESPEPDLPAAAEGPGYRGVLTDTTTVGSYADTS